jgi:isocitrate dehydrogenase
MLSSRYHRFVLTFFMTHKERMMPEKKLITVAHGDGIGPEIMAATLSVLEAAGALLDIETIEIGERVYHRGISAGIEASSWDSLRRSQVFLKAPVTTPQGGGFKSLNVTVRKTLGLYANVRPCIAYAPFVNTKHPQMDVVIIRENEEDLYAGIEHRQTHEVFQCLKLISIPGCERIIHYAFDYARQHHRKKVTCFTKDNIMKLTDGLFHQTFDKIAAQYPDITAEHWIVDIGAAKLADEPSQFDVMVMPNLYGDILSDVAAQIAGSVGLAGSANIGEQCAMFEAIHGSAPRRAGQDVANPSGLLLASIMMLNHIGQPEVAESIHNAWLRTLEEGIHTYDIFDSVHSQKQVGTQAFARAVVERLGKEPKQLKPVRYQVQTETKPFHYRRTESLPHRELVGVDVFLNWPPQPINDLVTPLQEAVGEEWKLCLITNRGVKVWPEGLPETFCTDHWRCRFKGKESVTNSSIAKLLGRLTEKGLDFIKIENLYEFDGKPGYSLGQGE